jgi:hypothetical protein
MNFFTYFISLGGFGGTIAIIISVLVLVLGIENPKRVWAASPQRKG